MAIHLIIWHILVWTKVVDRATANAVPQNHD